MDIFATIRNIGPTAAMCSSWASRVSRCRSPKGWLRASHRRARPALSLPYRPYHPHIDAQWLEPGEPVRVDVEIWPTCMVFKKGHRIRLDIQPRDGVGSAPYTHYSADYNSGNEHVFVPAAPARRTCCFR